MKKPLTHLRQRWRDLSISTKLYSVAGIMCLAIAAELCALVFVMNTLSSVRAFVGGEGLWSKAQKGAVYSLHQHAISRDPKHYNEFLDHLSVPLGDRWARLELEKRDPDLSIVYSGFIQGKNHPDDIPGIVRLFRNFRNISYISEAIRIWSEADVVLDDVIRRGNELNQLIRSGNAKPSRIKPLLLEIDSLNERLTALENQFSYTLGEGSRWLEKVLTILVALAALLVGGIAVFLTYSVSHGISWGVQEISDLTRKVTEGDFSAQVPVRSRDELGELAASINHMVQQLEESIQKRVQLATALESRDEFISIASHELKGPITALKMLLDLTNRSLAQEGAQSSGNKFGSAVKMSQKQVERLIRLVEELLDLTAIQAGKLAVTVQPVNLSDLVKEVLSRLGSQLEQSGCEVTSSLGSKIIVPLDPVRIEQVIVNLVSNAAKYAPGKPVSVELKRDGRDAVIFVRDFGPGIAAEDLPKVFERFHRAKNTASISGLGLGLYITRQIIEAHGGTIQVQSTRGQGTTFTVRVPANKKTTPVTDYAQIASY